MMINYEMYKIHREGEKEKEKLKDKKGDKKNDKLTNIDEDDEQAKVTVVPIEDNEENRRLERKKRSQEDMVADFVKILEQMNPYRYAPPHRFERNSLRYFAQLDVVLIRL
ncbi:hypothetical protein RB195_012001 [Necator americanus]|uniref:BESS domain-containing protein n=1 Tax=Necator americanus TaxID=51031 RepID=A0ABR1D507_NECAM